MENSSIPQDDSPILKENSSVTQEGSSIPQKDTSRQKLMRISVNTRVESEGFARNELNTNLDGIEIDWWVGTKPPQVML